MLIGNVLEKTPSDAAWQLSADKLADWVRTSFLDHKKQGSEKWEDAMHEDPAVLPGLREEGFEGLVGLDYIFKWWGAGDPEALGGEIDVLWKTVAPSEQDGVRCYRTWIKLAERDFTLGLYPEERVKRERTREAFREAFAQWRKLFTGT